MANRNALLTGATGLIGSHCLEMLLSSTAYERVITLSRRPPEIDHEKLDHHVVSFDRLVDYRKFIIGQDVFCCLGTTMKKAGSKEAFRKVDFSYPFEVARYALENGAEQYLLVSSIGADKHSVAFYSRVKGKVEEAIGNLPYDGVHIFRPSLLKGDRQEQRRGEQMVDAIFTKFDFLWCGPLKDLRPIEARTVAAAMIAAALGPARGLNVYSPSEIRMLAEKF